MTEEQYARMVAAAQHLLDLKGQGVPVDEHSAIWARGIIAGKRVAPPLRPAFQVERLMIGLRDHPPEGLTFGALMALSPGLKHKNMAWALHYLVKTRRAWMIKIAGGRSRYFRSEETRERGRPLVEAQEQARALARIKPPKPPKAAPQPKKPRHRFNTAIVQPKGPKTAPSPSVQSAVGQPKPQNVVDVTTLPPGVAYSSASAPPDKRYTPEEPIRDGYLDEWKRKRGETA